jgi:hypothetical protein
VIYHCKHYSIQYTAYTEKIAYRVLVFFSSIPDVCLSKYHEISTSTSYYCSDRSLWQSKLPVASVAIENGVEKVKTIYKSAFPHVKNYRKPQALASNYRSSSTPR